MNWSAQRILLWGLVTLVLILGAISFRLHNTVNDLEARLSDFEKHKLRQVSLSVIGLDQDQGHRGQYFIFKTNGLDALLGRETWEGKTFVAVISTRGRTEPVRLWPKQGEPQLGFGRMEKNLPNFEWAVGDELFILHPK